MYFPTSAARQLSVIPPLPTPPTEPVICLVPSPRKFLFCTLTKSGVALWRARPSAILAYLSRTPTSLAEHGDNVQANWSPNGTRIVIQTTGSFLVLVSVDPHPDETVYQLPRLNPGAQQNFMPGPGEGMPLSSVYLRFEGVIQVDDDLLAISARRQYLLLSTKDPPKIQRVPWPEQDGDELPEVDASNEPATWMLNEEELPWLVEGDVTVSKFLHSRATGDEVWLTSDGRLYFVRFLEDEFETSNPLLDSDGKKLSGKLGSSQPFSWQGTCIHDFEPPKWVQKQRRFDPSQLGSNRTLYAHPRRAVEGAINGKFSLIAVGLGDGSVELINFPVVDGVTPLSEGLVVPNPFNRQRGSIYAMEWSSDGYVLAVGWQSGWAIFSVGGRCLAWSFDLGDSIDGIKFQDVFMYGVRDLFWGPGNFELFVLSYSSSQKSDGQLFVIPFAKSASTGQHSPDNTRYAFLLMDDRALVYRGADQPDMSVINPESDVWQYIKIPQSYLSSNWPIQYSSLSSDGRLIAVAGQRGLAHYSSTSGRWKLFSDHLQEQAFAVKGGMLWFHHVLIAAIEVRRSYQLRLYSRDLDLSSQNVLHRELLSSPVVIMSLVDNSLLVYSADNTLSHFLVVPTSDTTKLHLCGCITFDGMIVTPSAVRLLSWMVPNAQKQLGNPAEDLSVATVLMMVGGQLVLLRPRRSGTQEVKYDMLIFAERIEFCWTHLYGIGALENSLWGYDGKGIRVWLNALAIEAPASDNRSHLAGESVRESVNISLSFYPLSVLMDKGIIIGVEHETAVRNNLPFVIFRHATSSHLFIHHILCFHLGARQVSDAVKFAAHYQNLVYFSHALEILLHTVVESEPEPGSEDGQELDTLGASSTDLLPAAVEFLDHFDVAVDVVVACARKTETTRWRRLFDVVGNPKMLFETCLASHRLKTAASYLLILHNLEQLDEHNGEIVRLLREAIKANEWQLCQELLRFIHSIDDTGVALRNALLETGVIPATTENPITNGRAL